jgi:predicted nucleic acid-binding protein
MKEKIIVDANLVISALLNTSSNIAQLLLTSRRYFAFYSTQFLREEVDKHKEKILASTGYSSVEFETIKFQLLSRIRFISEEQIPFEFWANTARLLRDIDPNDTPYLALNEFIGGRLWSGDKKLLKGLLSKGYFKCLDTSEMLALRKKLKKENFK